MYAVNMAVFPKGPGDSMTVNEKIATINNSKYWKSYVVHRWLCSDRSVSTGENEVCKEDIDEVGDILLLSFDRIFRRMRCGTRS